MNRFSEETVADPMGLVSVTIKLKDGSTWEIRKTQKGYSAVNPIVSSRVYYFDKVDGFDSTFEVIKYLAEICLEENYDDNRIETRMREYLNAEDTRKEARQMLMRHGCSPIGDEMYIMDDAFPCDNDEKVFNNDKFNHFCKKSDELDCIIPAEDKIFVDASNMDYNEMVALEKELRHGEIYGYRKDSKLSEHAIDAKLGLRFVGLEYVSSDGLLGGYDLKSLLDAHYVDNISDVMDMIEDIVDVPLEWSYEEWKRGSIALVATGTTSENTLPTLRLGKGRDFIIKAELAIVKDSVKLSTEDFEKLSLPAYKAGKHDMWKGGF